MKPQKKIANQLILGFVSLFTLLSLITGIIFLNTFYTSHVNAKAESLLSYAYRLSESYTDTSLLKNIEMYDALIDARVWLIEGDNPPLISEGSHKGHGHIKEDKNKSCHNTSACRVKGSDPEFIKQVLDGNALTLKSTDQFYYGNTLTVGVPIYQDTGVVGAILIHAPLDTVYAPIIKAAFYLIISLLLSNLLVFILAKRFATSFTSSIRRMKEVALELTEGNYTIKTNILKEDEIGELSQALDTLSIHLDEASKETLKLERIRQDFVTNVSHEFRTPLTLIKGHTEALLEGAMTDPHTSYETILHETKLLERLVSDLLDLSRMQQHKIDLNFEELSLHEVIRDAARILHPQASNKSINLSLTLEPYNFPIESDYLRLRQIFIILIDNAIKYTPEDGKVTIALQVLDTSLEVIIQDTGIGISKEELEHIWERFYKTDKARTLSNSSGIGLAIAKHLFEILNIQYAVESELGQGTCIRLSFTK